MRANLKKNQGTAINANACSGGKAERFPGHAHLNRKEHPGMVDDYGYFGKGVDGYAHYMQAFERSFGQSDETYTDNLAEENLDEEDLDLDLSLDLDEDDPDLDLYLDPDGLDADTEF
jgi:hypothetical protein